MKKINILLTLYSTANGGAEESVLSLAKGLANNPIFNVIIFHIVTKKSLIFKKITNKQIKYINFNDRFNLYRFLSPIIMLYLIIRYNVDIVNHNFRYIFEESLAAKLLRTTNVATIRAIFFDRKNANEFKFVKNVVGISQAVSDQIKLIGYTGCLYTIYNGVEFSLLNNFNLVEKTNKLKLFTFGRLVKWKRTDWAIKVVKELHDDGYNVSLDIFGEGTELENLQKLIKELNSESFIQIKGHVDRNETILSEYGILLMPSFAEPFGKTLVESIYRNKVIVATNYGAIPEILPKYPLLFERDNLEDFLRKTKLAIENFDIYLSQINKFSDQMVQNFSIENTIKQYQELFINLKNKENL